MGMLLIIEMRSFSDVGFFSLSPCSLSYQINLLGEKDDTPVHFCDKCGLPIKMYGRMVSGRCSNDFPLGKIRLYYVSVRPLEVTDFSRPLNKHLKNIRMETAAFPAGVFFFHLSC